MEELWELRRYVEAGDVDAALALLDEMEEMGRDDKITRIRSYMKVMLAYLIKQTVEKRTSRSWDVSMRNALDEIATHNKRRKASGWYLTRDELVETLREAYELALDRAALEAFGGAYPAGDIRAMHDPAALLQEAMQLIEQTQESAQRPSQLAPHHPRCPWQTAAAAATVVPGLAAYSSKAYGNDSIGHAEV